MRILCATTLDDKADRGLGRAQKEFRGRGRRVLVCSSRGILTVTFPEGFTYPTFTGTPVCSLSSTFSLYNTSSSFCHGIVVELISPVNERDFRDLLDDFICVGLLASGELTPTSLAFLHEGLAFPRVASVRLVLFIDALLSMGQVPALINSNK